MQKFGSKEEQPLVQMILLLFGSLGLLLIALAVFFIAMAWMLASEKSSSQDQAPKAALPNAIPTPVAALELWQAPDPATLSGNPEA